MGLFSNLGNSLGGFVGMDTGAKAPGGLFSNQPLQSLTAETGAADRTESQNALQGYANGTMSSADLDNVWKDNPDMQQGLMDDLATSAQTGSKFAAEQLQNNPTYSSLFGPQGQLSNTENLINQEQNQGFNLTPGDQTLYGQAAGNIARQFGQQGSQTAQDLASRGLSNSGAAGAAFSGLAGSQNEMLAQAQQQIAQQRFQNTQNQIQSNQTFAAQLDNQYNTALNNQYGRQAAGVNSQRQGLESAAGLTENQNNAQNNYGMQQSMFDAANKPVNVGDYAAAGMGSLVQASAGGAAANNMNNAYQAGGKAAAAGAV